MTTQSDTSPPSALPHVDPFSVDATTLSNVPTTSATSIPTGTTGVVDPTATAAAAVASTTTTDAVAVAEILQSSIAQDAAAAAAAAAATTAAASEDMLCRAATGTNSAPSAAVGDLAHHHEEDATKPPALATANANEPTTRIEKLDYVLQVMGLRSPAVQFLKNTLGFSQIRHLESIRPRELESWVANDSHALAFGDVTILQDFQKWLAHYRATHNGSLPASWSTEFTERVFDDFVPNAARTSPVTPLAASNVLAAPDGPAVPSSGRPSDSKKISRETWRTDPQWIRFRTETDKSQHIHASARDIPDIMGELGSRRRKRRLGKDGPRRIVRACKYCSYTVRVPGMTTPKLRSIFEPSKLGRRATKACTKCLVFLCTTSPPDGGMESCFQRWHSRRYLPEAPATTPNLMPAAPHAAEAAPPPLAVDAAAGTAAPPVKDEDVDDDELLEDEPAAVVYADELAREV